MKHASKDVTAPGPLVEADVLVRPRVATPVTMILTAPVLAWLGERTLAAATLRYGWWLTGLCWMFAAVLPLLGVQQLRRRRHGVIRVTPDSFTVGERIVRRFQVTAVRKYADLGFRGVRIDCGEELWLALPSGDFEPGQVLKAFRKCGYPVER